METLVWRQRRAKTSVSLQCLPLMLLDWFIHDYLLHRLSQKLFSFWVKKKNWCRTDSTQNLFNRKVKTKQVLHFMGQDFKDDTFPRSVSAEFKPIAASFISENVFRITKPSMSVIVKYSWKHNWILKQLRKPTGQSSSVGTSVKDMIWIRRNWNSKSPIMLIYSFTCCLSVLCPFCLLVWWQITIIS